MQNKLSFNIGQMLFGNNTGTGSYSWTNITDVGKLVGILVSNAVFIAGFLLIIVLVYAGFQMISGAGQSNPQKAAQGRSAATAAALGFLIIFTAYWIVKLLEVIFGFTFI